MEETQQQGAPQISAQAQYVKDFSFENPHAPAVLTTLDKEPKIDLSLDLHVKKLEEKDHYEIEISISAKATNEANTLFIVELKYGGIFFLSNVSDEHKEIILAVHCPSILFPYARKIISDATQAGGFQPLMIDPIDFAALYSKKMTEKNNA